MKERIAERTLTARQRRAVREVSTLKHLQTTSSGSARVRSLSPDAALAGGGGGCGCGGGCEISPTLSPFIAIFSRFREIQLFISNKLFWAFFFLIFFSFDAFIDCVRCCCWLVSKAGFFPFTCCSRESVLRLNSVSFCKAVRWTRVGLLPWGHVYVVVVVVVVGWLVFGKRDYFLSPTVQGSRFCDWIVSVFAMLLDGHVSVYAFLGHFMSTVRHLAKFIFSWSFYPFRPFNYVSKHSKLVTFKKFCFLFIIKQFND